MSFTAVKEKDCTQIYFDNRDKKRYFIFIFILLLQVLIIGTLRFTYEPFASYFNFLLGMSSFLVMVFFLFTLVTKSLKLDQTVFAVEYKIFGILVYKRSYLWKNIQKLAVELTRLKDYDILLQVKKRFIYLGESLDENSSDSLLKEIQFFHHYTL